MSIIYSRDVYFKVPFRSVLRILFCRTFPAMKNAMSEKLDHSNIPSLIYSSDDYHYWTVRSGMKIIYSIDVYSIVPFRSIQFQELRILFFCCRTYPPMYSIVWDPNLIETHLKVEFYYSDVSVFIIRSAPFHYNYLEDEDHDKLLFYDHIESQRNGAEWKNRSISVKGSWKT